jgi:hypothetical protein
MTEPWIKLCMIGHILSINVTEPYFCKATKLTVLRISHNRWVLKNYTFHPIRTGKEVLLEKEFIGFDKSVLFTLVFHPPSPLLVVKLLPMQYNILSF